MHNGFFYARNNSPIIKNVIDSMVKIGTNIPKQGPDGTCRKDQDCSGYWYNLVLLRDELQKAIGQSLKSLSKPVDIKTDKYGKKIMFLTERNNDFFMGPDGKEFYQLKHEDYPY